MGQQDPNQGVPEEEKSPIQGPLPQDLFPRAQMNAGDMKPWEQRAGPGMGEGGGGAPPRDEDAIGNYERSVQEMNRRRLEQVINEQTDFVHLSRLDQHTTPQTDLELKAGSNEEAWKQFNEEQLYDTRRVTLDCFHLFEWYPLAPGKFHTREAQFHRLEAAHLMIRSEDNRYYYTPQGKSEMLEGGIGAVRLRPTRVDGQDYYFMTASSNGVCHEGFPVLVPREFYGPLKESMQMFGAAPVVVSGEMRYVPKETVTFFETSREFPLLYLHADDIKILDKPRTEITNFMVSVAVSFRGEVQGHWGEYVTYCTFDPASSESMQKAVDWIDNFYVQGQYKGTIITDFDDVRPHFPDAVFGLPKLRSGTLSEEQVRAFLKAQGFAESVGNKFLLQYNVYRQVTEVIQGDKYVIGDITNSTGIAIGRGAAVTVNPPPTG